MPDFVQKKDGHGNANGETDWNKFFMGAAVAVVFVMQTWSQMQHDQSREDIRELSEQSVPRAELNDKLEFSKDNRKIVFRDIDRRIKKLEFKQEELMDILDDHTRTHESTENTGDKND